jgi:hypothetical protein
MPNDVKRYSIDWPPGYVPRAAEEQMREGRSRSARAVSESFSENQAEAFTERKSTVVGLDKGVAATMLARQRAILAEQKKLVEKSLPPVSQEIKEYGRKHKMTTSGLDDLEALVWVFHKSKSLTKMIN